ncbi:Short-chain dehydrogenase [Draconibacterium orientale]|jgi:short-subunit dehydrogenase|uniref:Short-chain dehydrogenase n=1 Tax=Draconibacterium orientale TaxID=1168034 RepID=X5D780_9BACT|nr:SDR family oxidoreductase [Draconibacterium orientale]AHW58508.1 short-chain dehydrogenase [Draconibacterium orientale]SET88044.1 Short-chain dehydrogenase [Draconibacterium orientale]
MRDKVVVITGASSGIGKALAEKYAAEGFNLVLAARRIERLEALKEKLSNVEVLPVKTDVSNEEDCKHLIDMAIEHFGKINILINNAGISMRAVLEDVETEVLRKVMDVNYWGTVYCTKYALPYLLEQKGSVVGVISTGGYIGLPGRTGYSSSKFAVRGFLDTLRVENLRAGLHVLVVAPGFTASDIRESALVADGSQQGKTPRDENKMMSAERCAAIMYRAIKNRRRKMIVSFWDGKVIVLVAKLWAWIVDQIIYTVFKNEPDSPLK